MSKEFNLGEKVTFVRMMHDGKPTYGEGVVIAKLIGVNKRINYSVKEPGSGDEGRADKAWNLEAEALNGTDEENAAYVAHHDRVGAYVATFTKDNEERVAAANKEIDSMHTEFFGAPLDV